MSFRSILVPTAPRQETGHLLSAALKLGVRLGAHLRLLYVQADPQAVFDLLPQIVITAGVTAAQIQQEANEAMAASKASFQAFCASSGISSRDDRDALNSTFGLWTETLGELEPVVAAAGRLSDLIVVDRPKAGDSTRARIFDAAVFAAGRPVLVLPGQVPDDLLRHVVILWNGGLEAARLVGHSQAILHAASRVTIICLAGEEGEGAGEDLRAYLSWHGVRAHLMLVPADGETSGPKLLAATQHVEATMILMGAYTHSRFREVFLGGVTRTMLKHATVPLLMEH